jgi:Zn-dependent protease with chaperone function
MTSAQPAGVDFFERQQGARTSSTKLVVLFLLAVVCIVAIIDLIVYAIVRTGPVSSQITWLIVATLVMLAVIGGGTLAKLATLRAGGAAVALSVGAVPVDPTTADPQLRRFVHVVEEMSIASGVPMPQLFVMPQEAGINAFAAGYGPSDAAVTVTAGALHRLNRDELQGVIGHEFSHILNGDMRVNVRLMGLLAGLLVLGLVGLRIVQFGGLGRRDKNAGIILVFGIAALVLGFVGQFFAGLIKAAVSRQREWLADASSVQFTRQTVGLSGALKKIAGVAEGSKLDNAHTERQINHMLFGEGGRSLSQLWATHPPLLARIQALEPGFRPDEVEQLREQYRGSPPDGLAEDQRLGLVDTGVVMPRALPAAAPPPARVHPAPVAVDPAELARRVATITAADLERGAAISRLLPPRLRELAGQPTSALPLILALLLDGDGGVRDRQLAVIAQSLSPQLADGAAQLRPEVDIPELLRLPLVGIAVPALRTRPRSSIEALLPVLDSLVMADGTCTVFEYCLTRLVASYLRDGLDPLRRGHPGRGSLAPVQDAAVTLLSVVALEGNPDPAAEERAFRAGVARLGLADRPYRAPKDITAALDAVWVPLDALQPRDKRRLVQALVAAIADDGVLAVAEAELLRTACALLHCPVPALLA